MIKRTFVIERGMMDSNYDRVVISGVKLPDKGNVVITNEFKPQLPPVGIGKVYIEDNMIKCDAQMHEDFITHYPAIGFKPVKWGKNNLGGVDMQECELIAVAVSKAPNMDVEIKRICDQRQVMVCSKLADKCLKECEHKEDKTICPNIKIKCDG